MADIMRDAQKRIEDIRRRTVKSLFEETEALCLTLRLNCV